MGPSTPGSFGLLGGDGSCPVTAGTGCSWSATTNVNWITFQNSTGSGDGVVTFTVAALSLGTRSGRVSLQQGNQPFCAIEQRLLVTEPAPGTAALAWTSELDLEGAQAQVVVDGSQAFFQARGRHQGGFEEGRAVHRVEGTLVDAGGTPGTWRFRLAGPMVPGSLRVIAGTVVALAADEVVFRLAGKPGERVLFSIRRR
jgi:hypothetical protein